MIDHRLRMGVSMPVRALPYAACQRTRTYAVGRPVIVPANQDPHCMDAAAGRYWVRQHFVTEFLMELGARAQVGEALLRCEPDLDRRNCDD